LYEYNIWYNHSVLVTVRYAGQDGTQFHLDLDVHQLHAEQPWTYEKPVAASAVLGS